MLAGHFLAYLRHGTKKVIDRPFAENGFRNAFKDHQLVIAQDQQFTVQGKLGEIIAIPEGNADRFCNWLSFCGSRCGSGQITSDHLLIVPQVIRRRSGANMHDSPLNDCVSDDTAATREPETLAPPPMPATELKTIDEVFDAPGKHVTLEGSRTFPPK